MSAFDLGPVAVVVILALTVLARSPYHRAIVSECLFHPLSDGWIDYEEDGTIYIHRGDTLPDYMLVGALQALEETERAVIAAQAKGHAAAQSTGSSGLGSFAAAAAAAGVGFVSAYLFNRKDPSNRSGG